jgi:hypothetical protein
MGRKNVAGGNDRVALQVGVVLGRRGKPATQPGSATPAGSAAPATTRVVNVRSGNARVGKQADVIAGDLHVGR